MINVRFEADLLRKQIADAQARIRASKKVMQEFGEDYLRKKADERFDQQGPGWAPLKEADETERASRTEARLRERAYQSLSVRLKSEQNKRVKLLARREKASDQTARGQSLLLKARNTIERGKLLRAEFERIKAGGAVAGIPAAIKQKSLADRLARRDDRVKRDLDDIKKGKALVGLRPLVVEVGEKGEYVEVRSPIKWSNVHNKGGQAGNNAQIPARPFLFLEPGDTVVLAQMLEASWAALVKTT